MWRPTGTSPWICQWHTFRKVAGEPGLDTLVDDFFESTVRDAAVAVAVDVVFYGSAPCIALDQIGIGGT